jgi:hypothetical protein
MKSMHEAVGQVLFENPASEALAFAAVEKFELAVEQGDDKAAAKWHSAMLSCVRGRPREADEADEGSPDEAARAHALLADAQAAQASQASQASQA